MKTLIMVFTALLAITLMTACGQNSEVVTVKGEQGLPGHDGNDGRNGNDGSNGYSIVAKTVSNPGLCGESGGSAVYLALDLNRNLSYDEGDEVQTQYVTCNGRNGSNGADGANGTNGTNGLNGTNGTNGSSCTVNKVGTVATITCGNSSAVIVDGTNGSNGQKGDKGDKGDTGSTGATGATGPAGTNASGIYISEVINPCGEEFANDEVFLKLSTGRILALHDGGANEDRLALIAPGNYITTDRVQNRACSFTITSDYRVTNQQVQSPGNSGN